MTIHYTQNLDGVDWAALKHSLHADAFDNGRTPDQLHRSFANSFRSCLAYDGSAVVGTARALSDGVCNAYVVDVWTLAAYRRQGIARTMLQQLLKDLAGQHVALFSDGQAAFYTQLGFHPCSTGFEQVRGQWLVPD